MPLSCVPLRACCLESWAGNRGPTSQAGADVEGPPTNCFAMVWKRRGGTNSGLRSNLHWGLTASRTPATVAREKKEEPSAERHKKNMFSLVCSWPIARQDITISAGEELGEWRNASKSDLQPDPGFQFSAPSPKS